MTKFQLELMEYNYTNIVAQTIFSNHTFFEQSMSSLKFMKPIWEPFYEKKQSTIVVGTERFFHNLFAKSFSNWKPCMNPVGSDLLYVTDDCYLHIDIKTVALSNIGDVQRNIFVGNNQTSFSGRLSVTGQKSRTETYKGNLPPFIDRKPVITLFLIVIYDETQLNIISTFITCMPNGNLNYPDTIISAGKNPGKIRFNYKDLHFKYLRSEYTGGTPNRTFICYSNPTYNFESLDLSHLLEEW